MVEGAHLRTATEYGPVYSKPIRCRGWPWSFNRKHTSTASGLIYCLLGAHFFPACSVTGLPERSWCLPPNGHSNHFLPRNLALNVSRHVRLAYSGVLLELDVGFQSSMRSFVSYPDSHPLFRCIYYFTSASVLFWCLVETLWTCTRCTVPGTPESDYPTADIEYS